MGQELISNAQTVKNGSPLLAEKWLMNVRLSKRETWIYCSSGASISSGAEVSNSSLLRSDITMALAILRSESST